MWTSTEEPDAKNKRLWENTAKALSGIERRKFMVGWLGVLVKEVKGVLRNFLAGVAKQLPKESKNSLAASTWIIS